MSHHIRTGKIFEGIKNEPPLASKKNPVLAFLMGFLFGPFGVALYFQRWMELLNCFAMLIVFMIILPGGGVIVGWFASGVYAAYRAHTSNKNAGY